MTNKDLIATFTSVFETVRVETEGINLYTHTLLIFMYIAKEGKRGALSPDLAYYMDMSVSSIWRNVSILADGYEGTSKALYLVSVAEDPLDRRRNRIYLTPKGEQLINKLTEKVGGVLHV